MGLDGVDFFRGEEDEVDGGDFFAGDVLDGGAVELYLGGVEGDARGEGGVGDVVGFVVDDGPAFGAMDEQIDAASDHDAVEWISCGGRSALGKSEVEGLFAV